MTAVVEQVFPYELPRLPSVQMLQSLKFPYPGAVHDRNSWCYTATTNGRHLTAIGRPNWSPVELALLSTQTTALLPCYGSPRRTMPHAALLAHMRDVIGLSPTDPRYSTWLQVNEACFQDFYEHLEYLQHRPGIATRDRVDALLGLVTADLDQSRRATRRQLAADVLSGFGFAIDHGAQEVHLPGYAPLVLPTPTACDEGLWRTHSSLATVTDAPYASRTHTVALVPKSGESAHPSIGSDR